MNIENAVEKYFAMWNEQDPVARRAVIGELWTEDAVSSDPMSSVIGHDAIDAMVAGIQTNMPPHRFELVGEIATVTARARAGAHARSALAVRARVVEAGVAAGCQHQHEGGREGDRGEGEATTEGGGRGRGVCAHTNLEDPPPCGHLASAGVGEEVWTRARSRRPEVGLIAPVGAVRH